MYIWFQCIVLVDGINAVFIFGFEFVFVLVDGINVVLYLVSYFYLFWSMV